MKNLAVSNVQILVVEDNSRYLDILVEELSGYHYKHIDTAQSPEEARKKLDKRPFDVIVADMRLGDDVSGGFAVVDEVYTVMQRTAWKQRQKLSIALPVRHPRKSSSKLSTSMLLTG